MSIEGAADGKRRLSVGALMPRDIVLTIPTPCSACENDTSRRGDCPMCGGQGLVDKDYEIRGNLPVQMMVKLLEIERRIQMSVGGEDVIEATADAETLVNELIKERSPSAPDFQFSLDELLGPGDHVGILGFIVSNRSVAAEVTETLVAGMPDVEEGSVEAQALADNGVDGDGGGQAAPLASVTASSELSSPSETSTPGGPSGGVIVPGEPSAATSSPLTSG